MAMHTQWLLCLRQWWRPDESVSVWVNYELAETGMLQSPAIIRRKVSVMVHLSLQSAKTPSSADNFACLMSSLSQSLQQTSFALLVVCLACRLLLLWRMAAGGVICVGTMLASSSCHYNGIPFKMASIMSAILETIKQLNDINDMAYGSQLCWMLAEWGQKTIEL